MESVEGVQGSKNNKNCFEVGFILVFFCLHHSVSTSWPNFFQSPSLVYPSLPEPSPDLYKNLRGEGGDLYLTEPCIHFKLSHCIVII